MQNPSVILWRLGVALGEHPSLEAPLHSAPALWISESIKQISAIIKQFRHIIVLQLTDGVFDVERTLFPRLILYMYCRSKLIEGSVEPSISDVLHDLGDVGLTSTSGIAWLSSEVIQKYLRKCIAKPVKLGYTETVHLNALYCLDILAITAHVFAGLSHAEKIGHHIESDLQSITDLLQELLDFGNLGGLHPQIITTLLEIFDKHTIVPGKKLFLKGVAKESIVSSGTAISEKASRGSYTDGDVAIKLIKASIREVLLWRQVNHPNVLSIYGLDDQYTGNYVRLVSPWMPCGKIMQYLDSNPGADRMSLVHDIALGLNYLHKFEPLIIHGNLTVENILINESLRACIKDYDFRSKSSPRFQTPENVEGDCSSNPSFGIAVDVYAFSTVFYEILVKRPGIIINPRVIFSNRFPLSDLPRPFLVDDSVWKLMQRCWSPEPRSRPPMSEVVAFLSRYLRLSSSACLGLEDSCKTYSVTQSLRRSVFDLASLSPAAPTHLPILLEEDSTLTANHKDIIIVVTGPSGSGKSSFINHLFGYKVAEVHDELRSCTQTVHAFGCMHPYQTNQKVIIVDTPGFDDSDRSDCEILEEISRWLEDTYRRKILLSAILQFHNISEPRMRGTPRKNLAMFQELCGRDAFKNVVLLTTFWDLDQLQDATHEQRERELQTDFWGPLIAHGSRVDRFNPPSFEHAWNIIDQFSPIGSRAALTIQIELVDQNKKLYETSVFKMLSDFWTSLVNSLIGKSYNSEAADETERARAQQQAFEKHKLASPSSSITRKKWFQRQRKIV